MKKRMHNIFGEDGKTFIMAFDHGVVMDIVEKAPDPRRIIENVREGGADVLLTTGGVAGAFADEIGSMGLIVRLDGGTTVRNPTGKVYEQVFPLAPISECNRLGADGVIAMLFSHVEDETKSIQQCATFAAQCNQNGLAFCIESVPGGFVLPQYQTLENIAFSARIACEMGADFVKVPFTGEAAGFKEHVVDRSYKPVVVLGGGGKKTDEEILMDVRAAMDAGCKGIAYGRLLWAHSNVVGICRAINKIIHDDATVAQAMLCLK